MNTRSIGVVSFDHLTIVVADLAESRRFYLELLGMEETSRPAFDFQGAWFRIGEFWLHLILANEVSGLPGPGDRGTIRASRGLHFAFKVANANRASQQLREAGISIVDGPKQRPDGATQVFIQDPDGYLIEIYSD